jgi:3-mercaptopyruvate sulfurtransferase SseA
MTTKILIPAALAVALIGASAPPSQADGADAARIALEAFKKDRDAARLFVVDVRGAQAYASGHIPGAVSIPLGTLSDHLAELKATKKPIVAYCA